jgi:uncharacterized pyridoxal phosphate-containing UPF0001 family protein
MGMATFTDKQDQVKRIFATKINFDKLKLQKTELSTRHPMGMSGDYQLAIECGSTMIRIGSSIWWKIKFQ